MCIVRSIHASDYKILHALANNATIGETFLQTFRAPSFVAVQETARVATALPRLGQRMCEMEV